MAMGMTYEQYWYGDVWMASAFAEAYELSMRKTNEQLWLQGMYIYEAVSVALNNGFRGKGGKVIHYAEKPYDIFKNSKSRVAEDQRTAEAEEKRKKMAAYFNSFAKNPKRLD